MKKTLMLFVLILLCACKQSDPEIEEDKFTVCFYNEIEDIYAIHAEWGMNYEAFGGSVVSVNPRFSYPLDVKENYCFELTLMDVPEDIDFKNLQFELSIMNQDGEDELISDIVELPELGWNQCVYYELKKENDKLLILEKN